MVEVEILQCDVRVLALRFRRPAAKGRALQVEPARRDTGRGSLSSLAAATVCFSAGAQFGASSLDLSGRKMRVLRAWRRMPRSLFVYVRVIRD